MILFQIATELKELKEQKKDLETRLKLVNDLIRQYEDDLVNEMVSEEIAQFKKGSNLFVLQTKTFVSPRAGMKPKIIDWMKRNGFEGLVKEDVHSQTLQSWARELHENGELPEELGEMLNVFEKPTISIRKAK
jgi:hypothetical protein